MARCARKLVLLGIPRWAEEVEGEVQRRYEGAKIPTYNQPGKVDLLKGVLTRLSVHEVHQALVMRVSSITTLLPLTQLFPCTTLPHTQVKMIDFGAAVDMCTGINFNPLYGMLDPRYSPPEELVMPQSEQRRAESHQGL